MIYTDPKELIFKTSAEVKAFAKWYLGTTVDSSAADEFKTEKERDEFLYRRASRLEVQVDNLRDLNLSKSCTTTYENQTIYKLCKDGQDPLSTIGSDKKSSRFNYKESALFKNRVVYFGQDKDCCYSEIFHSDFMRLSYPEFETTRSDELPRPKYKIYEYEISVSDLLVVTSSSTFKAIGATDSILKDEWFDLNFNYDIPSSSQIFAAIAKSQSFMGILYASVRNQTKNNLVLFDENVSKLELICTLKSESDFDLDVYEVGQGIRKKVI